MTPAMTVRVPQLFIKSSCMICSGDGMPTAWYVFFVAFTATGGGACGPGAAGSASTGGGGGGCGAAASSAAIAPAQRGAARAAGAVTVLQHRCELWERRGRVSESVRYRVPAGNGRQRRSALLAHLWRQLCRWAPACQRACWRCRLGGCSRAARGRGLLAPVQCRWWHVAAAAPAAASPRGAARPQAAPPAPRWRTRPLRGRWTAWWRRRRQPPRRLLRLQPPPTAAPRWATSRPTCCSAACARRPSCRSARCARRAPGSTRHP